MRRRPTLVALALVVAACIALATPAASGAVPMPAPLHPGGAAGLTAVGQEPDAPADDGTGGSEERRAEEPLPSDDIIPQPNSGRPPEEAGDRGGALQVLVFLLIVGGIGGIAAMIVRESRRNRARQAG